MQDCCEKFRAEFLLAQNCCCSTELSGKINVKIFCEQPTTEAEDEENDEDGSQDHVFKFWRDLTKEQQDEFDEDYNELQREFGLSLEKIQESFSKCRHAEAERHHELRTISIPRVMNWELKKPPGLEPGANMTEFENVPQRRVQIWKELGFDLYSMGRVAIVIASGGMDTRIGEGVPKGVLDFGLMSGKSIFQLYCERITRLLHLVRQKYNSAVRKVCAPLYVMCNSMNRPLIEDFFRENKFFGLREQDIMFFLQKSHPVVDHNGKIMLEEKHKIMQFPAGNGSMMAGLVEEGMISDMKTRGCTCMYVCSIDNILAKIGDPVFVGCCENSLADCGLKLMKKIEADEHLGCFVSKVFRDFEDIDGDGKMDSIVKVKAAVYEYFEMSSDLRRKRDPKDQHSLEYCAGNLSQYFFRVDFVKRVYTKMNRAWHLIPKRLAYIHRRTGEKVIPHDTSDTNAYRMEHWLFDSFTFSNRVAGFLVSRSENGIIKQPTGQNSPDSAIRTLSLLHQSWILKAGGKFNGNLTASEQHDQKCEVSPLVSYDGEGLAGHFLKEVKLPHYSPSLMEYQALYAVKARTSGRTSVHYVNDGSEVKRAERQQEIALAVEAEHDGQYEGERAGLALALPPTPEPSIPSSDESEVMSIVSARKSTSSNRVSVAAGGRKGFQRRTTEQKDHKPVVASSSRGCVHSRKNKRVTTVHSFYDIPMINAETGEPDPPADQPKPSTDLPKHGRKDKRQQVHKTIDDFLPHWAGHDEDDIPEQVELFDEAALPHHDDDNEDGHLTKRSILSGWSRQAVCGEINEVVDHAFGHMTGNTGNKNTGRSARGFRKSEYFWAGESEGEKADHDDAISHGEHTARRLWGSKRTNCAVPKEANPPMLVR